MTIPLPSKTNDLAELSQALDQCSHETRIQWMRGLNRKELEAAYVLAQDGPTLELTHFHAATGEVIIHHGQNSLLAFNEFQKRVVDNEGTLQGYNHQALSWITGPGHFTLRQDGSEVLFDYTEEPAEGFDAFPPLKSNTSGFSTLVYGHMVDRVRRVSQHCVIGAAFKKGKAMGAWFMLIREGGPASVN